MNEAVKEYLKGYNAKNEYGIEDDDLLETLLEGDQIYSKVTSKHRWWNCTLVVVDIGGKLIGYEWAATTGDNTARDLGWEFDEDSVCFVEKKEEQVTVTTYHKTEA